MSNDKRLNTLRQQYAEEYDRLKQMRREKTPRRYIDGQVLFLKEIKVAIAALENSAEPDA